MLHALLLYTRCALTNKQERFAPIRTHVASFSYLTLRRTCVRELVDSIIILHARNISAFTHRRRLHIFQTQTHTRTCVICMRSPYVYCETHGVRNVPSVHGFVCATVGLTIAYTRKCTIQYMYCITLHICSIYADICLIVPYAPICMWQVFDAARCWRSELVGHNGIITIKRRRTEWRQRQRLDLFASVQAATPATHIYSTSVRGVTTLCDERALDDAPLPPLS